VVVAVVGIILARLQGMVLPEAEVVVVAITAVARVVLGLIRALLGQPHQFIRVALVVRILAAAVAAVVARPEQTVVQAAQVS
jgi:hypothetical protein